MTKAKRIRLKNELRSLTNELEVTKLAFGDTAELEKQIANVRKKLYNYNE